MAEVATDQLQVWVDQDLCTGDGLCVQYAPEVFEFDIDGLAYVKGADGGEVTQHVHVAPGQCGGRGRQRVLGGQHGQVPV
ncbi:ferredoxin, partial [Micromonospora sp. NPDC005173]|uniref:ferredoxin n=1 Tax=Micromonospora sp. NPDC005173 TaxID=3157165 RepID=UPI0033A1147F